MPAITVSAVNTGTEELTATAHGLLTGDRFRLRNVGGALPAATPSLAAVTDYFAIVTGANTLKVAVSSANALAGTAVNLTGSGSGTTTVEYGLPFCIPTALAAAGTQIKSADANGTWNALVALYAMLTGQSQSVWKDGHGDRRLLLGGGNAVASNSSISRSTPDNINTTGSTVLLWTLPLRAGDRIKSGSFVVFGDGAVDITTISLDIISAADVATNLASGSLSNVSAAFNTVPFTVSSPVALSNDDRAVLKLVVNASGLSVGSVVILYDHPPA